MTFEEAVEFYNEGKGTSAFMAVLQKICDLEAKLDETESYRYQMESHLGMVLDRLGITP